MTSRGDLFRPPAQNGALGLPKRSPEAEAAKMEAFRTVKPICVSLMAISTQSPTLTTPHARLIDTLRQTVDSIPASSFVPSLINYILFPITRILRNSEPAQLPDSFLESAFRLLARLVRVWVGVEGGMDEGTWEQLWRFTVAAVSQRLGGRGKGKEIDQEVQVQAVFLLTALLEPRGDLILPHPGQAMLKLARGRGSKLLPTLLQTISMLVDISTTSSGYLDLQISVLRLLRTLVSTYLSGQAEILASVLPGIVSAVTKGVQREGKAIKSAVALQSAGLIGDVVVGTLSDDQLRSLGVLRPVLDDLSQLAETFTDEPVPDLVPDSRPTSPTPSHTSTLVSDPFPPLSASYLAFTSSQLHATIPFTLSTLASHSHHDARSAALHLASSLLSSCTESLASLTPTCLTVLLLLSTDPFDPVRTDSKSRLRHLLTDETIAFSLHPCIVGILSNAVNSLPRLIVSKQDDKTNEVSRTIQAIAEVTVEMGSKGVNVIADFLGPQGAVERWGWALLNCLEFGRPPGWSAPGNVAARAAAKGWEQRLVTSSLPLLIENTAPDSPNASFPHLQFRHIESEQTARSLAAMLVALGTAGGDPTLYTVDYFVRFAKAHRRQHLQVSKAVSAIWVADHLLQGISKNGTKASRKMARDVTKLVVSMNDDEDEDEEEELMDDGGSDALIPAERMKGVDALTMLLDREPRVHSQSAAETRKLHSQAQSTLINALSLSMLSTTSRILGSSFRPLLLNVLYTVLSYLASPHDLIQSYAELSLVQIGYNTGYASPQNLVLDNVDYVINVVSQRLTYHRLSPHAPLVLIAMIRLVGEPIVPLVHDVVDEIFDALDDFHGYETLCSALLAVLVTLIEVMAVEVKAVGVTEEREKKLKELRRIGKPPNSSEDFGRFVGWYKERAERSKVEIEEIIERAPKRPWSDDPAAEEEQEGEAEQPQPAASTGGDSDPPLTRSQEVCKLILEKSMFYLSHRSSFLRARVLSLIAHAVPVLAAGNHESSLLPLIDSGWGRILYRLDDTQPYVVTEAAEAIASLAENVGDFMSRRILDHAWPRFRKLLAAQREIDRASALVKRGAPVGTETQFSTSHRLHTAILRAITWVVRDVPIGDEVLWEMTLCFRPFLDRRTHEALQDLATGLYKEVGKRDADAVWVVIKATVGGLEGDHGVWAHLRDTKLDIQVNAERILKEL